MIPYQSTSLAIAVGRTACTTCGRVIELFAYDHKGLDNLDHHLAVLAGRHVNAHETYEVGDVDTLTEAIRREKADR